MRQQGSGYRASTGVGTLCCLATDMTPQAPAAEATMCMLELRCDCCRLAQCVYVPAVFCLVECACVTLHRRSSTQPNSAQLA